MTRCAGREALTLALNAAEGRLQIALARGPEFLCAQDWAAGRRGTELLAPALERIFSLLHLRFAELERIACVRGPGSFTGIRLVLATAAALARASGASQAGLDYLQLLAQSAAKHIYDTNEEQGAEESGRDSLQQGKGRRPGRILVLTHARRDSAHARLFTVGTAGPAEAASELELLSPEACARLIHGETERGALWLIGNASRAGTPFGDALHALRVPVRRLPVYRPEPEDMLLLARHAEYGKTDIEALYARPCDAVENLAGIAAKLGDDPAEAYERLEALLHKPV